MKKVIRLTESELTNLIQRIVEETKDEMMNTSNMDGEMEEGFLSMFNRTMGDRDEFEQSLKMKFRNYEYLTGRSLSRGEKEQMMSDLTSEAEEDGFQGELKFMGPKGERELVYVSGRDAEDRTGFVGFR